jgi:hypothetical protein
MFDCRTTDHHTVPRQTGLKHKTTKVYSLEYTKIPEVFFKAHQRPWWQQGNQTNSVAPEPEGSSPHSQQPANGPYPEPGESTPHPPNQYP